MTRDDADARFDFSAAPDPCLLWKTLTQGFTYHAPDFRVGPDRLYVNGYVLDPETGSSIDEERQPVGDEHARTDIDGTVFSLNGGLSRRTVIARSPNGQLKWTSPLRPTIFNAPLLSLNQGGLLISGSGHGGFSSRQFIHLSKGYVLALHPQSGDVLWMFATDGEVSHRPVVADGRLFVADSDNETRQVYCLSMRPRSRVGECLWRCQLAGSPQAGTEANGLVYWGSYRGHLYALDASTGAVRWRFHARRPVTSVSPPCVIEDWIFFACREGYVYGLDRLTGALRWKTLVCDAKTIATTQAAEAAQREAPTTTQWEDWSEDERREWEQYQNEREAEHDTSTDSEGVSVGETTSPDIEPAIWAAGTRLYTLAQHGVMCCYDVSPGSPGDGRE
jgi:outer membrane protein assembly factor BamB